MKNAIILEERCRRRNLKYQGEEICFRTRIDVERLPQYLLETPLVLCVEAVRELFQLLIDRTVRDLRQTDMIRFVVNADGLDKPISTKLMNVSELTTEKVVSSVMKVLQSKTKIRLDSGFRVDVLTIRRDIGAGGDTDEDLDTEEDQDIRIKRPDRIRRVINAEIDRIRKQCIWSVPINADDSKEGICCAKAIVYALARLEDNKQAINAYRNKDRPALRKRARELHEAAGVPIGPCTYSEIKKFQDHLNVQIAVFSTTNENRVSISFYV